MYLPIYFVENICFFGSGPPTPTPDPIKDHPTPHENNTYAQYFQQKLM